MRKGIMIIVIGPSGCGKGTVLKGVLNADKNTHLSVSATTRDPRPGERAGVDYDFIKKEEFEHLLENGNMLEYTKYCDNYYGTPKIQAMEYLDKGENVILEIEIDGAEQVKKSYPDAVRIFMLPPSMAELERRLINRNTEDEDAIKKRMTRAREEMNYARECEYVVMNDEIMKTVSQILAIIKAEESKTKYQEDKIKEAMNS